MLTKRAIRPCQTRRAGVYLVIFVGGIDKRGGQGITGFQHAPLDAELAGSRPSFNLGRRRRGKDSDLCLAFQEQAQLGQRRIAAAGKMNAPPLCREKDWKVVHCIGPIVWVEYRKMFQYLPRDLWPK